MKKQRTSRTWMVTLENIEEEYKLVGVSSAEEAIAKAKELGMAAISARPMRKFKPVDLVMDAPGMDVEGVTAGRGLS